MIVQGFKNTHELSFLNDFGSYMDNKIFFFLFIKFKGINTNFKIYGYF